MTDRVLTDDELETILRDRFALYKDSVVCPVRATGRAVESAVVAKLRLFGGQSTLARELAEMATDASAKHYVTEREARTRERAAWYAGWARARQAHDYVRTETREEWQNEDYPSPTKRVPRTVTLSDGTSISATTLDHGSAFLFTQRTFEYGGRHGSIGNPLSLAQTPADARLLADLVERPYEEIVDA